MPDSADASITRCGSAGLELRHPNILAVDDSQPLPPGGTLRELLNKNPRGLFPYEARRLGVEVASALAAAHKAGVIHGDLRPENVLIDGNGTARVMNFGLVRRAADTVHYLAPEQLKGGPPDMRGDIYALGALMYELVTGKVPHCGAVPPLWRWIPPSFRDTVMQALRPEPELRFDSMESLMPGLLPTRHPIVWLAPVIGLFIALLLAALVMVMRR